MTLAAHSPFLISDWPLPAGVRAICSSRGVGGADSGVSQNSESGHYASLNLGDHVGDAAEAVAANRALFSAALQGAKPVFLQQVHGRYCLSLSSNSVNSAHSAQGSVADACSTQERGLACTIMVADCLPVLFCNQAGTQVAAAHAGWRGLADGVLEEVLGVFSAKKAVDAAWAAIENQVPQGLEPGIMAWLGPCIGWDAFEVGSEVRAAFLANYPWSAAYFKPGSTAEKWLCHLAGIARQLLQDAGIAVYGNDGSDFWCTYSQSERWFSHRRESQQGRQSGRMAVAIYRC